jgi:hypothetical protein
VGSTFPSKRESLVERLAREFHPMPVRKLVADYLARGNAWNERRIVLFITAAWQEFKREGRGRRAKFDRNLGDYGMYILRETFRLEDRSGIGSHCWWAVSQALFRRDSYRGWRAVRCAAQWLTQLEKGGS